MCNSRIAKEEVFINQNAAGNNDAMLKDIGGHLSNVSIITYALLAIMLIFLGYFVLRYYKSCHRRWIQEEIGMQAMSRIRASIRNQADRANNAT